MGSENGTGLVLLVGAEDVLAEVVYVSIAVRRSGVFGKVIEVFDVRLSDSWDYMMVSVNQGQDEETEEP